MALKFSVQYDQPKWLKDIRDQQRPVAEAAVAALRDVAAESVQEGRADIAAAGAGFRGAKWLSGLQYRTRDAKTADGEASLQAKATVFHKYGIAGQFEYGATIRGRPLMWIPTKHGAPTASKFGGSLLGLRGRLVSATVNGTPVLFDARDKDRHRKPLYIGVPQVTIPKKFHITEIVKANVEKIARFFLQEFKGD